MLAGIIHVSLGRHRSNAHDLSNAADGLELVVGELQQNSRHYRPPRDGAAPGIDIVCSTDLNQIGAGPIAAPPLALIALERSIRFLFGNGVPIDNRDTGLTASAAASFREMEIANPSRLPVSYERRRSGDAINIR